ncbi:MAG: hypothetical protein NVS9B4_05560 [Candidatus Acidiferrum sp.]
MSGITLNPQEFSQGDPKLGNHEAEHNNADAGANPCQKRALVGEMVASSTDFTGRN